MELSMSNPAEKADTQKREAGEATFADRVKEVIDNAKVDAKGNLILSDDLPEELRYAVTAEKRLRDTQASYTKTRQELKAKEAEKSVLVQKVLSNVSLELTAEQAEELDDLKFSDPEAWRKKVNAYEMEALKKREKEIDEDVKKVSGSALEEEELERRKEVLASFLETHEGFDLNDEIIENDIPPRISKKLANGSITFEQFLQECYDFSTKGKVIKQEETLDQPNLSRFGGSGNPDKNAVKEDIIISYSKETY